MRITLSGGAPCLYPGDTEDMTSNALTELYRVAGTKGPRYYRRGGPLQGHRLFPVGRDAAELAIAQGATVYEKTKGEHWMLAEPVAECCAAELAEQRSTVTCGCDACEQLTPETVERKAADYRRAAWLHRHHEQVTAANDPSVW